MPVGLDIRPPDTAHQIRNRKFYEVLILKKFLVYVENVFFSNTVCEMRVSKAWTRVFALQVMPGGLDF